MKTQQLTHHRVQIHGISWYYRTSEGTTPPNAPAIVMLHGLATSNIYMLPTARLLAPHYRVYIPDMPGFGKSTKPKHVFTLIELADMLVEWMQEVGIEQATWLSNSLGCQIIAHLAMRHPDCVERMVLVGPAMDPQALTAHQEIGRWLHNIIYEPKHLYPIVFYDYARSGLRRIVTTLRYGLQDRIDEHLPLIKVPTLVVRGSCDTIVPQRWAEEATHLLPDGQLVVIEGAAHDVNYNSPKQLAQCVRDFVGERV